MLVKCLCGQRHAHHHQKGQRQHLDGRVAVDKIANRLGRHQHDANRRHHGRHHYPNLVHHTHRRDDGVQRKHNVDDGYLANDSPEHLVARSLQLSLVAYCRAGLLARFDLNEDFVRGLVQQEEATQQQHKVTSADALVHDRKQVSRQAHHPAQRKQQQQPRHHGEAQAQPPRLVAPVRRQPTHKDGYEDDVVDAQYDFQRGQHRKRYPDVGVE